LGLQDYEAAWQDMQTLTGERTTETSDEIWLLQHPPVYTLGLNGKRKHLLIQNAIPVIPVDRGGQVTYHGPGQLIAYLMCDLSRLGMGVSEFVQHIEQSVIDLLNEFDINAERRKGAPGVYVDQKKIAALGLRIKKNCSYHGLSLNVDMDLQPFEAINACGEEGLEITQLKDLGIHMDLDTAATQLLKHLQANLGYNDIEQIKDKRHGRAFNRQ
jgi:lipoyl(octanoyl) transferase